MDGRILIFLGKCLHLWEIMYNFAGWMGECGVIGWNGI